MVRKNYFNLLFLLLVQLSITAFPQNQNSKTVEETIKQVIINETKSWAKRDYEGMKGAWIHNEHTLLTAVGSYFYSEALGWDSVVTHIKASIKNFPEPIEDDITWSDWNIQVYDNCAWATFIQTRKGVDKIPFVSRELRFLEKKNGMWRFTYLNTMLKSDYQTKDAENNLNAAGYKLLGNNKIEDAIDVFKMNVKLYPKSSNVYDSLGEAYMKNGDKELAIENYKKSLEFDPKNENAKTMLTKLSEN